MPRLRRLGVARGRRLEEDHLVELEALRLTDVGDVEAALPSEVLFAHAAHVRDLRAHEAVVIDLGLLRETREERDVRIGLVRRELAERIGEERDGLTR